MGQKASARRAGPAGKLPPSGHSPMPVGIGPAMMALQSHVGNKAFGVLATKPAKAPAPAPKPAKAAEKLPLTGEMVDFTTPSTKVGDHTVSFTGRVSITGAAKIEGETMPEKKDLPKGGLKEWATDRVNAAVVKALGEAKATGDGRSIALDFGGEKVTLELAQDVTGMPTFGVSGHFTAKKKDLTFGTVSIPKASITLDLSAWIAPGKTKPGAVAPPAGAPGDKAVRTYSFAGGRARFDDKQRSGALVLFDAVARLEKDIHPDLKDHPAIRSREQKVAMLQEMRPFFGSDDRTIDHFTKIRRVELVKGRKSDLYMHDEAAARLEAVRDEIAPDPMPTTTVGWPRSAHALNAVGTISNLHQMGMAVDFNANETPHLTKEDPRDADLVGLVTGGVGMSLADMWRKREGAYDAMILKTAERGKMADPAPTSAEGKFLDAVTEEARKLNERSEAFKRSLDVKGVDGRKEMARLRAAYHSKHTLTDADKDALKRLVAPWRDTVDASKAKSEAALREGGIDPTKLLEGKALDAEKKAVGEGGAAAAALVKNAKGGSLNDAQRKQAQALIEKLRPLLGTKAPAGGGGDAAIIEELTALEKAAGKRLKAYGQMPWYARVKRLRESLDDEKWVLGASGEARAVDPAPGQLLESGYFNLKANSKNAGAFDLKFVRAMVKHGFLMLAAWTGSPDSMHFELRWNGPGTVKPKKK